MILTSVEEAASSSLPAEAEAPPTAPPSWYSSGSTGAEAGRPSPEPAPSSMRFANISARGNEKTAYPKTTNRCTMFVCKIKYERNMLFRGKFVIHTHTFERLPELVAAPDGLDLPVVVRALVGVPHPRGHVHEERRLPAPPEVPGHVGEPGRRSVVRGEDVGAVDDDGGGGGRLAHPHLVDGRAEVVHGGEHHEAVQTDDEVVGAGAGELGINWKYTYRNSAVDKKSIIRNSPVRAVRSSWAWPPGTG